jgi:hypothetical protein
MRLTAGDPLALPAPSLARANPANSGCGRHSSSLHHDHAQRAVSSQVATASGLAVPSTARTEGGFTGDQSGGAGSVLAALLVLGQVQR